MKVLHSICQQIWKIQQWPQDWKGSVFTLIPKKGNAKECSNYCTIALISHASKVRLKILQASLQQYVNHELPDVQAGFRKGLPTSADHRKTKGIPEKYLFLLYFTDFSRGRSSGLVFPSLSEFSTVYCDPHSQRLWHSH